MTYVTGAQRFLSLDTIPSSPSIADMSAFDSGRTTPPLQLHIRVNAIIFAFLDPCFKKLCASVKCLTLGRRQICEPYFAKLNAGRGESKCVARPSQSPSWSQSA